MINHFNFDMILEKLRIQIPSNIKSGIISKAMLAEVSDSTLKMAVSQLKNYYKYGHSSQQINTETKLDHVLHTLEKIVQRKYHFDKANIDQAEKINSFYYEANIEVGSSDKRFTCQNCKIRQFSSNSALHSHMRSCRKPFMEIQNIQIVHDGEQVLKKERAHKKKEEKIAIQENQFMDEQFLSQSSESIFEQQEDEKN